MGAHIHARHAPHAHTHTRRVNPTPTCHQRASTRSYTPTHTHMVTRDNLGRDDSGRPHADTRRYTPAHMRPRNHTRLTHEGT